MGVQIALEEPAGAGERVEHASLRSVDGTAWHADPPD